MTHTFQFDPNAILGVPAGASLREIRDAYHQKSMKHHPDKGGDEWAFRMVARAYEILSTARVVDRANVERPRPAPSYTAPSYSPPPPPPPPRATWTNGFGPSAAAAAAASAADAMANIKGWSGAQPSHVGLDPIKMARLVVVELLILRFELECSLDLFTRSAEDRNLSCTLHVTWPVVELSERAPSIPDAAKFHKRIIDAMKARGVRKHALNKRSSIEENRLDAWLTYPTAVMASDALESLREALQENGLEMEKQVREMAVPRTWS